jgi:hypothetical protein
MPTRRSDAEWVTLAVPRICERMIGFSVPQDDTVLVVSYEGMHLVRVGAPVTVERDDTHREYDLYDVDKGIARYRGREWRILGLHGGRPILDGLGDERLTLDTKAESIAILRGSEETWSTRYENLSGDWAAVTFSPDRRLIVLGCPYDLDFRVWERRSTRSGST